ncbi:MAG TPA: TetR/AcrR family transcriptional regulator [Methanobacterium sp.]|nr:TetR/AcrR family transcriptional regulator [Methanobacterium sp.]
MDNQHSVSSGMTVEDRILDAAMMIFSKNGFHGSTTIKIAQKAGVNEITIFRKFKSKENLLKAVVERNLTETLDTMDYILCKEKSTDIEICIKNLGITLKQFLDSRMDFIHMMITEGKIRPDIKESSKLLRIKLLEHLKDYFIDQMNQGTIRKVDPNVLAFDLFSFIFYKSLSENIFGDNLLTDDEKTFEDYSAILMKGILI